TRFLPASFGQCPIVYWQAAEAAQPLKFSSSIRRAKNASARASLLTAIGRKTASGWETLVLASETILYDHSFPAVPHVHRTSPSLSSTTTTSHFSSIGINTFSSSRFHSSPS